MHEIYYLKIFILFFYYDYNLLLSQEKSGHSHGEKNRG